MYIYIYIYIHTLDYTYIYIYIYIHIHTYICVYAICDTDDLQTNKTLTKQQTIMWHGWCWRALAVAQYGATHDEPRLQWWWAQYCSLTAMFPLPLPCRLASLLAGHYVTMQSYIIALCGWCCQWCTAYHTSQCVHHVSPQHATQRRALSSLQRQGSIQYTAHPAHHILTWCILIYVCVVIDSHAIYMMLWHVYGSPLCVMSL